MELFDQTPSRSSSRFGKLSSNMFFTRNTAQPKRVRHIEGLNGALICSVNDDPSVAGPTSVVSLGFNRTNLPSMESSRRAERLVPPMGFWNTYGVIQDTDRWRQELASLASSSGLGVEKDERQHHHRPTTTADQQHASRSGARYSARTGRFNEGTAKSRGRTGSKHGTGYGDELFNVPENEREMWMLQVLCQLLGTSNLEEVQSWLVSASHNEKEQARTMINSALRGLKESDRTTNQSQNSADLNALSSFIDQQKNDEKQVSQKYIKESLHRPSSTLQTVNEEQQIDTNLGDGWTNLIKSNLPPRNTSAYNHPHQSYNRRSYSSFDTAPSANQTDHQDEQEDDSNEQIDTIQLDEDRRRPQSVALTNKQKPSKIPQTPVRQSFSTHQQKHRSESLQLNDKDDDADHEVEDIENGEQQSQETNYPSISNKESSYQDDDTKIRKIRQLQNRLSRQEDEAKKQITDLQTKQSRLENAVKLLVKQTSSYEKRRQPGQENTEKNQHTPLANILIDSRKETEHRHSNKFQETNSSDNRPTKSYSGIWKPDASTLHRLQGN